MRLPVPAVLALALAPWIAPGCAASTELVEVSHVQSVSVDYEHGGEALTGYLSYDPRAEGLRPGVLVVHEWWGLGEHPRNMAKELARMGFVAFAADMYGTGRLTDDPAQAREWASRFRGEEGRMAGRARAAAGLEVLRNDPRVDPGRLAAIGFCFGGTVVQELAWSGADLDAVVSFHGTPSAPRAEDVPGVRAAVLICHGAEDAAVTPEQMAGFEAALRATDIDWMIVKYARAVHSFTNPEADGARSPNSLYDERAARRAWNHMADLFRERLGPPAAPSR